MIINDLYANGTEYWTGSSYQQYKDIMAQFAGQVGIDTYSPDAYWLGWISKDNIPVLDRSAHCTVDDGICTFEEDIDDANFPITYAYYFNSSGNVYQNNEIVHNENGSNYNQFRFINQMYPEYSALYAYTNWQLYGRAMIYDAGENLVSYRQSFSHGSITTNPANIFTNIGNFIKFYEYGGTMQMSFGSTYGTITISSEDFRNGTFYVESTTGYFIRGFFTSYSFPGDYYITHQNDHSRLQYFYPFVSITCNSDGITQYSRAIRGAGYSFNNIATLGSNGTFSWVYDNSTYGNKPLGRDRAGMHGTIDTNLLTSVNPYMWDGNVLCILDMYDQEPHTAKYFFPIITMDDVYKTLALNFRVDVRTYTNGYVNGSTYATDVTADNEFLAKLKTGDIEDPNYKNSLRPWQYENFQEDDFTEEDVPPYEPPEPGGDDDPGSDEPVETPTITGDDQELQIDRTLPAPTDFITLYVITPPILSRFGRTLWTSLADYDPQDPTSVEIYKNFFAILNEQVTGTLDISSVLNYVISVRQYPFDVSDLPTVTQAGNSITFGTGKLPIDCGSAAVVCTMSSTIGILDCGEVTIADYNDFKLYNDFRDYHNTTVTAFLPYCGTVELNPMETIHNTIHCYYAIDFYTGECTAYLTVTDEKGHKIIAGIKNGIIGVLLPITATNSGQLSGRHTVDNAMDSSLVTGFFGNAFGAVANLATGNVSGMANNIVGIANQQMVTRQILQGEREGRSAVMSPSLSGGTGAAAFYQPAGASILVRRGTYARDKIKNYPQTCGYPATSSGTLSSFQGYTECYNVDVSGINCTDEEKSAIKALLESGVYL